MTSVPSGCPHLPHVPASTPWPDLLLLCHFRSGRSTAPTQMQHCLLRFWEKDNYSLHLQLTVLPSQRPLRVATPFTRLLIHRIFHTFSSLLTTHSALPPSLSQTAGNSFYFTGKRRGHVHMLPPRGEAEPPLPPLTTGEPMDATWALGPFIPWCRPKDMAPAVSPPALSRHSLCTGSPPTHSTKTLSLLPSQPNLLKAPSLPAASWLLHSWISSPRSSRTLLSRLFLHHPVEMVEVIKDFSALLLHDLPAAALGTGVTLPP